MAMLAADRRRAGWSVEQAAHELRVSIRTYRELEARRTLAELGRVDRICRTFNWPQTFVPVTLSRQGGTR